MNAPPPTPSAPAATRPTVLLDRSVAMLRMGRDRMARHVDNGRWIARTYMEQMRRMGHFATVRTADEFVAAVAAAIGVPVGEIDAELKGNLLYVCASRPSD